MRIAVFIVLIIIATGIQVSCKNGNTKGSTEDNISSDIVKNPNSATGNTDTSTLPAFQFDEESHDFGRVIQGEKVSYSFKFKNTGSSSLVISDAKGSCGCTVADYPKKAIAPGEAGDVNVKFDTEGRKGFQSKTITLIANTQPNTKILTIKALIQSPEGL